MEKDVIGASKGNEIAVAYCMQIISKKELMNKELARARALEYDDLLLQLSKNKLYEFARSLSEYDTTEVKIERIKVCFNISTKNKDVLNKIEAHKARAFVLEEEINDIFSKLREDNFYQKGIMLQNLQ